MQAQCIVPCGVASMETRHLDVQDPVLSRGSLMENPVLNRVKASTPGERCSGYHVQDLRYTKTIFPSACEVFGVLQGFPYSVPLTNETLENGRLILMPHDSNGVRPPFLLFSLVCLLFLDLKEVDQVETDLRINVAVHF